MEQKPIPIEELNMEQLQNLKASMDNVIQKKKYLYKRLTFTILFYFSSLSLFSFHFFAFLII